MATRIIQLSDLHIGKSSREETHLKTIVSAICDHHWGGNKPIILITGDIVNDGKKKQFYYVRDLLDPLYKSGFTVFPIPGNHDYGWKGNHAIKKRFKHFKSAFYHNEHISYPQVKEINGHTFIGLNSMKAESDFFDGLLADGELGTKQLKNLSGVLKKCQLRKPYQKIILFVHHHPFLYPDESDFQTLLEKIGHWLKDGEELMALINGQVDMLFFGHEHRHLDFSGTQINKNFNIPNILSCGKSTSISSQYKVQKNGHADYDVSMEHGLLGFYIVIKKNGRIRKKTIRFNSPEGIKLL